MNGLTERDRKKWDALTPEQQAAVRAGIEERRRKRETPEGRAEEELVRVLAREDAPPRDADGPLKAALAAFRAERERQGLSLTDLQERTHIDRATISKLERGEIPNPTVGTLRVYAAGLGKRLAIGLADLEG